MSSLDDNRTEAIRIITDDSRRIEFEAVDIVVNGGPDTGLQGSYSLPVIRIGTALDNDIVLTDRAVSRHHAEIHVTKQGLLIRDLGSTNGTFVGQLRVTEAYLTPDTSCTIGYSQLSIQLRTEEHHFRIPKENHLGELVGASEPMRELFGYLRAVADTPTTVLINGESGCGKELVARTLHELSGRPGALVVFDASVTDHEMVRNDLFGHVKGAFTGAAGSREGAFRRAHEGTLFIDEIGELPLDLQPRLLRALENREVTPIGSDQSVRVDVRVVAATHRDLAMMVQEGSFRADLYYRLSVLTLRVPPLRDISQDIPLLVKSFIQRLGLNCQIMPDAMEALKRYHWPGNVRELRNVLERAAVLCKNGQVGVADLMLPGSAASAMPIPQNTAYKSPPPSPAGQALPGAVPAGTSSAASASRSDLKELERQMIIEALARNGNNKTATARELDIPLSTLKRRLKDYQIE
ncbi:MAG: sigma 54-dependent Fis family transcriptional regulator [Candidatus Competibacteraceae bacterium]|nr:sigma 54-dependent Fis family transcriptional regulator [Candidatus Competibacteraceae bacterium]